MSDYSNIWFFEDIDLKECFCPVTKAEDRYNKQPKKSYKKSEFIYFSDDTADKVFFIHEGAVKISSFTEDGNEIIKAILQPGEIFGELAVYGEDIRNESAQAVENTELCILDKADMVHLMRDVKGFQQFLNRLMGERIIYTQKRLESLLFKDAKTRIADYILEQAERYGRHKSGKVTLKNYLTHQEIANYTGTSRQTVTTILNELRDAGHIEFDRKKIVINHMESFEGKDF